MNLFRRAFFCVHLSRFSLYRKWYGGRWINMWTSICGPARWFLIDEKHTTPSTAIGTPIVEDWPFRA